MDSLKDIARLIRLSKVLSEPSMTPGCETLSTSPESVHYR